MIDVELPIEPIRLATFSLDDLAEWLARATDENQSRFFNEFSARLALCCEANSSHWQMQALMLKKNLSSRAKDFFNFVGVDE
jgi:hypothetical protein